MRAFRLSRAQHSAMHVAIMPVQHAYGHGSTKLGQHNDESLVALEARPKSPDKDYRQGAKAFEMHSFGDLL